MNRIVNIIGVMIIVLLFVGGCCLQEKRGIKNDLTKEIEPPENKNKFSFIVFGDTRTELCLKGGKVKEDSIMFKVRKFHSSVPDTAIKLYFNDAGNQLDSFKIERKALKAFYSNGWPDSVIEKGAKAYDPRGYKKIYEQVAWRIKKDRQPDDTDHVDFAIHTGDVVLWNDNACNEYWQEFTNRFYDKLKQADCRNRLFPVIGNHEYWDDYYAENYLSHFDHLRPCKDSIGLHYYSFRYGNSTFIFLCSGGICDDGSYDKCWNCSVANFWEQMAFLDQELSYAKKHKVKHVFITYHKPSFSHSKHGPLIPRYNPTFFIERFKKENRDINITVFSGHNHTTEVYVKDEIRYLVIGGGGAMQYFKTNDSIPGQPEELYWKFPKGDRKNRVERYNFLKVDVDGEKVNFTLFNYEPIQGPDFKSELLPDIVQIKDLYCEQE